MFNFNIEQLDKNQKISLGIGGLLILLIFVIFFLIIPGLTALKRLNATIIQEQKTLNYIIKYSHKIASIKSYANTENNNLLNKANPHITYKKRGYITFLTGLFKHLNISKISIKKLNGIYSKNKNNKKAEKISIILEGLTLNQVINIIYNIRGLNYNPDIISLRIYKNFNDNKLLNLNVVLNRRFINGK